MPARSVPGKNVLSLTSLAYGYGTCPGMSSPMTDSQVRGHNPQVSTCTHAQEAGGNVTRESDVEGDLTREIDGLQNSTKENSTRNSDMAGNSTMKIDETENVDRNSDGAGNPTRKSDETGNVDRNSDRAGNSTRESDETGNSTRKSDRAGNSTRKSDRAGNSTRESDRAGNSTRESDRAGNSTRESDRAGNSTRESDRAGNSTRESDKTGNVDRNSNKAGNSTRKSDGAGNSTRKSDGAGKDPKKMVSFKPVTLDPISVDCDVIICLWNNRCLEAGSQPLLEQIGVVIEDIQMFKSKITNDLIYETAGGTSRAATLLHCKYDTVSVRQIRNALLRCVLYTESVHKNKILVPLIYYDDLLEKPEIVTSAAKSVISQLQLSSRYQQHLHKLYLCVDNDDTVNKCRKSFRSVKTRSPKECCQQGCPGKAAARVKTLATRETTCTCFCIPCLKHGRQGGLCCPQHGPCLSPVGHENSLSVVVSGFEHRTVFKDDAERMDRVFQSPYIGVREHNTRVVTLKRPGTKESLKQRLKNTFSELKTFLHENPAHCHPSCLYFYFSGHNTDSGLILGGAEDTMSPKELKREFQKLHMDTIFVILDCCYSGGMHLTESLMSDEFMVSLTSFSLEGLDSIMVLPKLWNLEESQASAASHGHKTMVYQWSSCFAEEKSFFKQESLFTDTIVNVLKGSCPLREGECEACADYKNEVVRCEAIFLKDIHACVAHHVALRARTRNQEQHPQLDMREDRDVVFAFHSFA